jgi:hypothetical protein
MVSASSLLGTVASVWKIALSVHQSSAQAAMCGAQGARARRIQAVMALRANAQSRPASKSWSFTSTPLS